MTADEVEAAAALRGGQRHGFPGHDKGGDGGLSLCQPQCPFPRIEPHEAGGTD